MANFRKTLSWRLVACYASVYYVTIRRRPPAVLVLCCSLLAMSNTHMPIDVTIV